MKKLTLAIAVLAVLTISLFSFSTKTAVGTEKTEPQTDWVWIRYSCQPPFSATPMTFIYETNRVLTTEMDYPTTWNGNVNFTNCRPTGYNICAVRFELSETEAWPGWDGHRRPKAGVDPWDGNHMYAYCQF